MDPDQTAGWSGSMLVANPLCWFCHGAAQIFLGTTETVAFKFQEIT
jgi:hypothetical protein